MEAQAWELALIEDAIERFWNRFFPQRTDLRAFALDQSAQFPQNYISAFIAGLGRARWSRRMDPGYEIARKIMQRLGFSTGIVHRDEYVCSIFDLVKRLQRIKDKEREKLKKKTNATQDQSPPWEFAVIEDATEQFWDRFFLLRTDLRVFALNQTNEFPPNYISDLIARLD